MSCVYAIGSTSQVSVYQVPDLLETSAEVTSGSHPDFETVLYRSGPQSQGLLSTIMVR